MKPLAKLIQNEIRNVAPEEKYVGPITVEPLENYNVYGAPEKGKTIKIVDTTTLLNHRGKKIRHAWRFAYDGEKIVLWAN